MSPPKMPHLDDQPDGSAGARAARGGVRRIAIGGRLLGDLRLQIHGRSARYESYRVFPGHQHSAAEDAEGITVSMPALAALQLYHEGKLTGDPGQPVELTVGRRRIAPLFVRWLRASDLPGHGYERVLVRLESTPRLPEQPDTGHGRVDNLAPLTVHPRGVWQPERQGPGSTGHERAQLRAPGLRAMWEMQRVLPGKGLEALARARAHIYAGRPSRARPIIHRLIRQDFRCLDAHVLLGAIDFQLHPSSALVPYENAARIGRQPLGKDFDGLLPWPLEGNRPFLRALQGCALCLWHEDRFEEAEEVLRELLELDPTDGLRVSAALALVSRDTPWSHQFIPAV